MGRREQCANGSTKGDRFAPEYVVSDGGCRLQREVLPTDCGLRREVRWVVAESTLDLLDRVPEVILVGGANRDEHPLVEDIRTALDGFVGRSGFVCSFLEVRTADALFQIGVNLEVVSDVL